MQRETRAMRRGKRAHRALEHHAIRGKVTVTRGVAAHTSHHTARQTFEAMCIAAAPVAWAGAEPGTARAMGPLRAGLCMDAALQAGGVVHANCVGNVRTVAEAAEVAAAQHCLAGTFDQRPKKRACTEASIGPAAATPAAPRAWKATGAGAAAAYDLAGAAVQAVVPPVPVQAAPSVHHAPDTSAADQPHALLTRDHGLPATLTAAAAPTAAAAAAGVIAGMTDAAAAALAPPPRTFRGCSKDSQASQAAVRVSVAVSTREDRWAISALDSVSSLHTLAREGSTREVFLFGQVAGVPVVGYADCLRLLQLHPERDDDDDARAGGMVDVALLHAVQQQQEQQQQRQEVLVAGSRNAIRDMQACKEAGALQVRDRRMVQKRMRVVEDKFRGSCHGLSGPQLESAVLQAMLYHAMLLQMRTATLPSIAHAWLRTAGLLPSAPLSRAVQRFASRLGLGRPANCMDVMAMVQDAFAVLPRMDECIQLQVRVGQAAVSIQSQRITYDESWMLERAVPQIAVWRGQRAPQGVQMQDMHYKCGKCSYACLCPAAKAAGKDVF